MFKITNFQLYSILMLLVGPVAFLEAPNILIMRMGHQAWIAVVASIIPGFLLVNIFTHIIQKSQNPFPLLLEEHLGITLGKALSFMYFLFFLLVTSFTLRLFVDFTVTNVLPQTPISVFIGTLLLIGYMAIKSGLENLARTYEIILFIGLPFAFLIIILSLAQHFNLARILPLAPIDLPSFGLGLATASYALGKMMPVLSLGFFLPQKNNLKSIMLKTVITYVLLITLVILASIMTLGAPLADIKSFAVFSTVRLFHLGNFVQNIDIVFIGIWILSIFGNLTITWFMACHTLQQLLGLKDYRFLAAPTALVISVFSILISRNILELFVMNQLIIPLIYSLFFIVIPFLLFLLVMFKPYPVQKNHSVSPT